MELYTTQLQPKDIKFKTVGTLRNSLRAILYNLLFSTTSAFATFIYFIFNLRVLEIPSVFSILICMIILLIVIVIYTTRNMYKYFVAAFIELPIDSYVLDMAKSVLSALRESELIDRKLSVDDLRVKYDENGYIEVFLDYAEDQDTKTFSRAFNELFEPIIRQRYMVQISEADMKLGIFTPFWYPFRKAYGMFFEQDQVSYHPVPAVLSVNRKKADTFLKYWREYVGGSKLVYTRSREGLEVLLKQRSKKYQKVRRVNLDLWK